MLQTQQVTYFMRNCFKHSTSLSIRIVRGRVRGNTYRATPGYPARHSPYAFLFIIFIQIAKQRVVRDKSILEPPGSAKWRVRYLSVMLPRLTV